MIEDSFKLVPEEGRRSQEKLPSLEVGAQCEPARYRKAEGTVCEDAYFSSPETGSFGIFDGIGGSAAGERASAIAKEKSNAKLESESPQTQEAAEDLIRSALIAVNEAIANEIDKAPSFRGMGTTAVLLKFWRDSTDKLKVSIGWVGDSRAGTKKPDQPFTQLTLDDGMALSVAKDSEAVRHPGETAEQAAWRLQKLLSNMTAHPPLPNDGLQVESVLSFCFANRNILTNSLGRRDEIETAGHITTIDVQSGDEFILTTDGIHDNLTDAMIDEALTSETTSEGKAKKLLERAQESARGDKASNIRAKDDDMTTLVIRVPTTVS